MQGFYFVLLQYSPIQAFTARFVPSMQFTIHAIKQHTELCRVFSCDCTRSTAHDTKPTQAAIIPPAPRWSVSQRRNTSSTYQIPAPRRTLYSSAQTAYYNNVYMGAGVRHRYGSTPDGAAHRRPCQPGEVSASTCTGSARRAARNHWRLPPQLFSGFRPIANRGQQ